MVNKMAFLIFFVLTLSCGMIWFLSVMVYKNQKLQNYAYLATAIFAFIDLCVGFLYMCQLEMGF